MERATFCIHESSKNSKIVYDSYRTTTPDFTIHLVILGTVAQSTISAKPGLNFNLLFWFMHFRSTAAPFKTLKNKSFIDQKIFLEKHVALHKQAVAKN